MRFLACLSALLLSIAASPIGESNADRLAQGLTPRKPARLYDPSRPRALQARASPSAQETFQVAAGPPPQRKRDVPGFFTVVGNALRFATSQADAASFYWDAATITNMAPTTLKWVAPATSGNLVAGTAYSVYAKPQGQIWKVLVGPPPSSPYPPYPVSQIFTTASYQGQLNPLLGQPQQTQLWIAGPDGDLYFAPDYTTAVNALGSVTVLLTQAVPTGQPPSLAAATAASAAQAALLKNPVRIYMRDATGTFPSYMSVIGNGDVYTSFGASSIYVPDYAPGVPQRVLTVAGGKNLVGSSSPISTGVVKVNFGPLDTTTSTLSYVFPALSGRVTLSLDGTPYKMYSSAKPGNYYIACDTPANCLAAAPDATELCLEAVAQGVTPTVCDEWARAEFAAKHTSKSALYVKDPLGTWSGYWAFYDPLQTPVAIKVVSDQADATFVYLDSAATGSIQKLFALNAAGRTFAFESAPISVMDNSHGVATWQAEQLRGTDISGISFNIPSPFAHGRLTVSPSDYINRGKPSTVTSWGFYVSDSQYREEKFPIWTVCRSLAECTYQPGARELCVEVVPEGSSPTTCV